MACRYEVTLNNVQMASLDSSIIIHDVCYDAPKYARDIFRIANLNGARTGNTYKESSSVTILFEIHEYSISDRQGVITKIINWAKNGGDLRINDRPNQKLICVCDDLPYIDSAMSWLNELSITFTAYDIPYWQSASDSTTTAHYSGSASTVKEDTFKYFALSVPGDAPYVFPKSIIISNFSATDSNNPIIMVEMKNASRNDGPMCLITYPTLNAVSSFEYSYDDRQIATLKLTSGTTVTNLQGYFNVSGTQTYDLYLTPGITNNVGLSLTKRVAGSPNNTYTPIEADMTIVWRGFWE